MNHINLFTFAAIAYPEILDGAFGKAILLSVVTYFAVYLVAAIHAMGCLTKAYVMQSPWWFCPLMLFTLLWHAPVYLFKVFKNRKNQ